jgi:site-specific recombinase
MQNILTQIKNYDDTSNALFIVRSLVDVIRPSLYNNCHKQLAHFVSNIETDELLRKNFKKIILKIINESDADDLFTETGLQNRSGIFSEITSRISRKIIPPIENKKSLLHKLKIVFHERTDYEWLAEIDDTLWFKLLTALNFNLNIATVRFGNELMSSLTTLSYRLTSLSLENDIRLLPAHREWFIDQNKLTDKLVELFRKKEPEKMAESAALLVNSLMMCKAALIDLKSHLGETGTGLSQTFLIKRAEQHIERMLIIADFADEIKFNYQRFIRFVHQLIFNARNENSLRAFLSDNVSVVAYQIAENKSHTGEHYIANDRKEYWKFFWSSCGGGLIVSTTVIMKLLIHEAHFAPFWEAVAYSLNYALAFIEIQLFGFTLATKQPAMTASAIAASLDTKNGDRISFNNLAIVVAKVFRSQTVSFVGNLLLVFPLTLLWFYTLQYVLNVELVSGYDRSLAMFHSNHPVYSLCLLYAAFTGVFLFLSGIISGYTDSVIMFSKIPQRIREHPVLKKRFADKTLLRISKYLDHNLGGLVGNFSLGFFLGTAAFIGFILGVPYDIRHITIASGIYSISAFELRDVLSWQMLLSGFWGVLAIGFVNFAVSFSLAFYVAVKSRNIRLRDYADFVKILVKYFFKHPLDFVFPPKRERTPDEVV